MFVWCLTLMCSLCCRCKSELKAMLVAMAKKSLGIALATNVGVGIMGKEAPCTQTS